LASPDPFPQSTPEAQGIPSAAVVDTIRAAEARVGGLDSLILLRHGHQVAAGWWAPYAPTYPHELFSLTKSFTSTAVGLAVTEGRLTVDDPVLDYFPDERPAAVSAHLAALKVRHLLTMTVGHETEPSRELMDRPDGNWVRGILAHPVPLAPGSKFLYNSFASHLLSAIVQQCTGERLVDYLQPRLFDPLGIAPPVWATSLRGVNTGGWGLRLRTEDIARFGQLYLQEGVWQGQRILPAAWVAAATAHQVNNGPSDNPDWEQGYGYQFWRCRHDAYRGDGMFGQYCIVMPEQEAVLAITSGVGDMQAVLDAVWAHLLPAMGPAPLPADPGAAEAMAEALAGLAHPPAAGAATSPVAARVAGRTFEMDENGREMASLTFAWGDRDTVTIRDDRGAHPIVCGHGVWHTHVTNWAPGPAAPIAASGAWTAADTYQVRICQVEGPFRPTLTCRFDGDEVRVETDVNVRIGDGPASETLVGRMV
jgi:CubicO group peptidase (beta-lactamase class C family)